MSEQLGGRRHEEKCGQINLNNVDFVVQQCEASVVS